MILFPNIPFYRTYILFHVLQENHSSRTALYRQAHRQGRIAAERAEPRGTPQVSQFFLLVRDQKYE